MSTGSFHTNIYFYSVPMLRKSREMLKLFLVVFTHSEGDAIFLYLLLLLRSTLHHNFF